MKLELKHLAPYLPYGLKFYSEDLSKKTNPFSWEMTAKTELGLIIEFQNKPILRPLSDLTKEIEHNGEKFRPLDRTGKAYRFDILEHIEANPLDHIDLSDALLFFEWHFDVFNLIESGLAIDINTLEKHQNKIK